MRAALVVLALLPLAACSGPRYEATMACQDEHPRPFAARAPGLMFGPLGAIMAGLDPESAQSKYNQDLSDCVSARLASAPVTQ